MNSSLVLGKPVYMAVTMQEPCDNQNSTQSSFIVRGVKNAASACLSTCTTLKNAAISAGQWVNENRATAALLALGASTIFGAGVVTGLAMFSEESQATCIATSELISINNGFDISGSGSGDFSFDVDSED